MNNYENRSTTTKKGNSKKAFCRKVDDETPTQKRDTPRILIIPVAFEGVWRSQGSKRDGAVSHFEFRRDYSNILRPQRRRTKITHYVIVGFAAATARFWKVPNRESQRHRSFAEDYSPEGDSEMQAICWDHQPFLNSQFRESNHFIIATFSWCPTTQEM